MTQPVVTQQPVNQPEPTATQQALAAGLWQSDSQEDVANIIAVVLLLDPPTALRFVTIIWHPTAASPRPWRKAPASMAAQAQAGYVINAVERFKAAADEAAQVAAQIAAGQHEASDAARTPQQIIDTALHREAVYAAQHRKAQTRRASAMTQVRKARRQYGTLLGWHATLDLRTTPACRIANGKNFPVATGPFPGLLHGGTCRCRPVRPFNTSDTVLAAWLRAGLGPDAEGAYERAS
jgi:hypothetical protein